MTFITSGVKIDIIRIENRKYQFLYAEGKDYHLMNIDDCEQIMLQKDFIDNVEFLKEGEKIFEICWFIFRKTSKYKVIITIF